MPTGTAYSPWSADPSCPLIPLSSIEEAELLGVPSGSPAFCLEHIFYDFTNRPIAWGWFICRADRFRLITCIGPDVEE